MTTSVDLDKLRAAAAAAAQKAADTAARVEAAAAAESAERERRAREWDEHVADFDETAARERVDAALRGVREALATGGDPFAAWMQYQVEHRRYWHATMEARAAAARLGRAVASTLIPSVNEDFNAVLSEAVAAEAARRVADELDERDAERERFIAETR